MSIFDSILGQVGSNVDVGNMASKLGISQDQAEQAIGALAQAHPQEGDTVETAAAQTGLPTDVLNQIVGHIGGEGSLGQFAQMIENNPGIMSSIGGFASSFFGKED